MYRLITTIILCGVQTCNALPDFNMTTDLTSDLSALKTKVTTQLHKPQAKSADKTAQASTLQALLQRAKHVDSLLKQYIKTAAKEPNVLITKAKLFETWEFIELYLNHDSSSQHFKTFAKFKTLLYAAAPSTHDEYVQKLATALFDLAPQYNKMEKNRQWSYQQGLAIVAIFQNDLKPNSTAPTYQQILQNLAANSADNVQYKTQHQSLMSKMKKIVTKHDQSKKTPGSPHHSFDLKRQIYSELQDLFSTIVKEIDSIGSGIIHNVFSTISSLIFNNLKSLYQLPAHLLEELNPINFIESELSGIIHFLFAPIFDGISVIESLPMEMVSLMVDFIMLPFKILLLPFGI